MAITTGDDLIASFPGDRSPVFRSSFSPQAAGAYMSLWTIAGQPGAGVNSADGVAGGVPTDATAGAFPFTNPTAPDLTYLGRLSVISAVVGSLFLYDRLWHNSGLSATLTSGQTVNSVALNRPDANGADVEAWWQCYTTMGAGTPTITISYTDQDGNSGATGTLQGFVTTAAANRCFQFALASGDSGVRSIQTYTNSATMTSGTFGLILRRLVNTLHIPIANSGATVDPITGGLPRIYDDACLELVWLASATTSNTVQGEMVLLQN